MTSKQLLATADQVIAAINPNTPFNKLLLTLSNALATSVESTRSILKSSNDISQLQQATINAVKQINAVGLDVRRIRLMEVFTEADSLKHTISQFLNNGSLTTVGHLEHAISLLKQFNTDLEEYWRNHQTTDAYTVIVTGARLYDALATLRTTAEAIKGGLTPEALEKNEDESEVSLYLPSEATLSAFGAKVSAVSGLYEEFCGLFGVSTSEFPLRIVKVESGTIWMDILGNTVVLEFLKTTLIGAVTYFAVNYTKKGLATKIPRQLADAEAVLKIADKLKEHNRDVSGIIDQVHNATIKSAAYLNELLDGEESVEMNGRIYPIAPQPQRESLRGRIVLPLRDRGQAEASK